MVKARWPTQKGIAAKELPNTTKGRKMEECITPPAGLFQRAGRNLATPHAQPGREGNFLLGSEQSRGRSKADRCGRNRDDMDGGICSGHRLLNLQSEAGVRTEVRGYFRGIWAAWLRNCATAIYGHMGHSR